MGGRSKDVLDLSGFRQGVEERRAGCGEGRARSLARRGLSRVASLPSRSLDDVEVRSSALGRLLGNGILWTAGLGAGLVA